MASATAMYTALSGMTVNARRLDVIGNNIANANTTAFKSSQMYFATQFSRTLSDGTAPNSINGGTNPMQIGLGVQIAGNVRDFNPGTISATGDPRDLAIEGRGFFVVDHSGTQSFTRAGAFRQNSNNELVTLDGDRVQGFGVDGNFNINTGIPGPISLPVGSMKLVQATRNVDFAGNLNSAGSVATQGSSIVLGGTATTGLGLIPSAPPANPGDALETGSLLSNVADPSAPASPLFAVGQMIQVKDAEKGSSRLPTKDYTITGTSTVQDLMNFLRDALGLNTTAGPNPGGAPPGVALNPRTGQLTITGNTGAVNDLTLDPTAIRLLDSSGTFVRNPLNTVKNAAANGESVRTSFVAYDSLGKSVAANLSMVMESKSTAGTTWRYYVDSPDETNPSPVVGTGLLKFDTNGQLTSAPTIQIQIDHAGTGAGTPLAMTLNLAQGTDTLTALAQDSQIASTFQDGAPPGILAAFGVGTDGVITGAFTNGLTRPLGQVAVATFTNQDGLVDAGNNLFVTGADSGTPIVTTPGKAGTGQVVGGALEQSNTDLGKEFINMILTSTGYTASSRVIQTADQLLQQLMVLGR